jgi:2'-5' RNA ligase
MAARGVPSHVTILFPFLAAAELRATVRSALGGVAAARQPFTARFATPKRAEGSVWLIPDEQRQFLDLTFDVAAQWPDHPPYGGLHAGNLIAHLTLVESTDRDALDQAWAAASEAFEVSVTELVVIAEDENGYWHERWRVPLGGGGQRSDLQKEGELAVDADQLPRELS